ncbi:hypothetical protein [Tessaracoccus defluvii]|uniref:Uncharacterized protein n=1 Tax=Tessaracoccus defluvii TaxID=1285901 RepID=A0A7H0H2Q1_9ACTN|nr:hypothetical protein [Tessaracoccus defluvii]QNP54817.1 hypothetical protein H9L22_10945 [Tessaracoccus defluvii]
MGAGAAAAYYRREPILAGILAFHARRSLLDPILEPWPSEGRYAQQADGWLDAVSGGVEALGAELARGINGPRPRDLVAVDPHTGTATPPELLVDTLQTYIDLTVNDRLARATRSVDEVAARQRARLREQLFTSTMEVLHESQNLGATTEFLEYLSTALGREAGAVWAASSAVGPEFDPPPLLKEIGEAVAGLPHGPSGATRAAGMAGIGLGVGVVLGGFVAPLVALGVGAAAALTGAGGVLLGVWMKRRALDGARRRLLDQLQQHVWFRVEQHITDQLWGLLAYLVRLVGRPDDLESGCLGGVAKMRASSQDYLQHLERVIAERFHEELTPTEFSIFLPRPEDSPTEALAARYGLPPEFDVTRALLAGITDGMDRPGGFVPEEAFARFYTAGGANPPSGLWNNLSELLADSPGALAAVGGSCRRGPPPSPTPKRTSRRTRSPGSRTSAAIFRRTPQPPCWRTPMRRVPLAATTRTPSPGCRCAGSRTCAPRTQGVPVTTTDPSPAPRPTVVRPTCGHQRRRRCRTRWPRSSLGARSRRSSWVGSGSRSTCRGGHCGWRPRPCGPGPSPRPLGWIAPWPAATATGSRPRQTTRACTAGRSSARSQAWRW